MYRKLERTVGCFVALANKVYLEEHMYKNANNTLKKISSKGRLAPLW